MPEKPEGAIKRLEEEVERMDERLAALERQVNARPPKWYLPTDDS